MMVSQDRERLIKKLEDKRSQLEDKLFEMGEMNKPPCFVCGYSGPGYYDPKKHPCAERHHRLLWGWN